MVVNGEGLTSQEQILVQMRDVADTSELQDVAALRTRQAGASILGKVRLQKQIDAVLNAVNVTGQAIDQAKRQ
jgi:hypothetical protein